MKALILSLISASALVVSLNALAAPVPPVDIEKTGYAQWLSQIGAPTTTYLDYAFGWYADQLTKPLPPQASTDPDKLFVTVDKPLAEAIRVESAGDVEEGSTYGLETYAIVDAPVATVLEAILFRWGKPVGHASGVTHPNDTVFGYRQETLTLEWGPDSFKTYTIKKHGGVASDLDDTFSLLLRGNATDGYLLAGSFIAPNGDTTTTSFITIIMIKPTPDGKTDYRVAGMQTGQNYSFFGLDGGRRNFGFNVGRIRDGQKDFLNQVKTLRDTGKIPERH